MSAVRAPGRSAEPASGGLFGPRSPEPGSSSPDPDPLTPRSRAVRGACFRVACSAPGPPEPGSSSPDPDPLTPDGTPGLRKRVNAAAEKRVFPRRRSLVFKARCARRRTASPSCPGVHVRLFPAYELARPVCLMGYSRSPCGVKGRIPFRGVSGAAKAPEPPDWRISYGLWGMAVRRAGCRGDIPCRGVRGPRRPLSLVPAGRKNGPAGAAGP